jgi:DNA-binding response OmpR family regulator
MAEERSRNNEKARQVLQKGDVTVSGRSRPRILVVDDDPQMRELLFRLLQRYRFDVALAENGQAAVDLFRRSPCDLVVTDLYMPLMGGAELAAVIKRLSNDTPIVMITGMEREAVDGIAGIDAVFHKPFPLDRFADTIVMLLEKAAAAAQSARARSALPGE